MCWPTLEARLHLFCHSAILNMVRSPSSRFCPCVHTHPWKLHTSFLFTLQTPRIQSHGHTQLQGRVEFNKIVLYSLRARKKEREEERQEEKRKPNKRKPNKPNQRKENGKGKKLQLNNEGGMDIREKTASAVTLN